MAAYGSAEAWAAVWLQECVQSVEGVGVGKLMADGAPLR